MNINPTNAAAAYTKALDAAKNATTTAAEDGAGAAADGGVKFSELLDNALDSAVEAGKQGETTALKSVTGDAALTDIVVAVSNAEVTLQTVVAVRDKVIEAYQEIIRMPI
ncbi:MAG: flagellar hook-basal body complex protein FliE [Minwuiales bacterium]|nr:flagellar hook-basal body complex protein FliE [Minwuiales bacterium]